MRTILELKGRLRLRSANKESRLEVNEFMIPSLLFFTASFCLGRLILSKCKVMLPPFVWFPSSLALGSVVVTLGLFGLGFGLNYSLLILYGLLLGVVLISWLVDRISGEKRNVSKQVVSRSQILLCRTNLLRQLLGERNIAGKLKLSFKDRNQRFVFIASVFLVLLVIWLFGRAMFFGPEGQLIAGDRLVWVDWPLHIGMAANFAWGNNVPLATRSLGKVWPENPTFAGIPLIYPFMADFVSGILLAMGASLPMAFAIPGIVLTLSFFWLFVGFVREIVDGSLKGLKSLTVGIVALVISLFWGGMGFVYWFEELATQANFNLEQLLFPMREYSFWGEKGLWFFSFFFSEILPQRAFLFGLPMFFLILLLFFQGIRELNRKNFLDPQLDRDTGTHVHASHRPSSNAIFENFSLFNNSLRLSPAQHNLILAGVLAGVLPFFHTHAFLSLWILSVSGVAVYGLLRGLTSLRLVAEGSHFVRTVKLLLFFFIPFAVLSLVQAPLFLGKTSSISFVFGWMKGSENIFWFWLKNTGLFIPLVGLGVVRWLGELKLLRSKGMIVIVGAATVLFIMLNFISFAPWGYDNLKLFTFWYLLSSIPVAYVVVQLAGKGLLGKLVALLLFMSLTVTGGLELLRLVQTSRTQITLWQQKDFVLAEQVKQLTPPESVFLTAAIHDHPVVSLAGRKTIIGFPGNSWSWGIPGWDVRETDVKKMFVGDVAAVGLWKKYGVDYIIVSDRERYFAKGLDEEEIAQRTELVWEQGNTRVYKVQN